MPTVSVGMHVQEVLEDSITLTWIVQNRSEQLLTFDENNIMQVKLNGHKVMHPTESATLEPGEQVSIDLELNDLNINTSNEVQITACSNEGTKAAFCKTIRTYLNYNK